MRSDRMTQARRLGCGFGVFFGALLLVGGCATNDDVLAVRRDLATLRNDVGALNRANQSSREFTEERLRKVEGDIRGRVESSAKESEGSRVALNQRLEELTTETRFVQGKLEENGSVLRDIQTRLDEADQRTRQMGQRLEATDQQVKRLQAAEQARAATPPAVVPGAPALQAPGAVAGPGPQPGPGVPQTPTALPPVAQPAAPAPAPAPAPVIPQVPTAPPAAQTPAPAASAAQQSPARPQVALPPEDLYKAALSDYTKGDYDLAIDGFRSYLKNYPKTSLAANAQYWLAECYFSQKNYTQAIDEFDVVTREYADSPKVPSALFKEGEAYLQMGDTKQATTVLCELISKHGKTREARLARDKNIRCR